MEEKQFPVSHIIFKQTKKGYFRQKSFANIIIQTNNNDDLH